MGWLGDASGQHLTILDLKNIPANSVVLLGEGDA